MKTVSRTRLSTRSKGPAFSAIVLALSLTACGRSESQATADPRKSAAEPIPFVGVSCAKRPLPLPEDVDYVQIRHLLAGFNTVLLTQGTPCIGAEREECVESVSKFEHYSTPATDPPCHDVICPMQSYAILVRHGRPELLTTPPKLRELLGSIDTPDEAWLMAMFSAKAVWPVCDQPEVSAYRRHSATFELRERRYTNRCPLTLSETIYEVGLDGSVTSSKPSVVSVVEGGCVEGGGTHPVAP